MNNTEIMPRDERAREPAPAITPMQMLQIAVERGADLDQLNKLMDLQERWEKNEARKAYVTAVAAFKSENISVGKNRHVAFGGGRGTEYDHATLDNVTAVLGPKLAEHGLSYSWQTEQTDPGFIRVTCTLTHVQGHSERVTLSAPADNSGSKNNIQAIGSTVTYLQRYTLLAITGTATTGQDDDGAGIGSDIIDHDQLDELRALMKEVDANAEAFCKFFKIGNMTVLPAGKFEEAKAMLLKKRAQKEKAGG